MQLERWNGRIVSITDPVRENLHTVQWPNPVKDLSEAGAALTALLFIPVLWIVAWLLEVRERRMARFPSNDVIEQHAQTS